MHGPQWKCFENLQAKSDTAITIYLHTNTKIDNQKLILFGHYNKYNHNRNYQRCRTTSKVIF